MTSNTIMVVEDEAILLMDVVMTLEDQGFDIFAECESVPAALAALESESPDAALLDISIGDKYVWPVARELQERKVPFLFVSADPAHNEIEEFPDVKVVGKPANPAILVRTLNALLAAA